MKEELKNNLMEFLDKFLDLVNKAGEEEGQKYQRDFQLFLHNITLPGSSSFLGLTFRMETEDPYFQLRQDFSQFFKTLELTDKTLVHSFALQYLKDSQELKIQSQTLKHGSSPMIAAHSSLNQTKELSLYSQYLDMLAKRGKLPESEFNNAEAVSIAQERLRAKTMNALEALHRKRLRDAKQVNEDSYYDEYFVKPLSQEMRFKFNALVSSEGINDSMLSNEDSRLTEDEFEKAFKTHVNATFILGPEAFKWLLNENETQFSKEIKEIALTLNQENSTEEAFATLLSPIQSIDAKNCADLVADASSDGKERQKAPRSWPEYYIVLGQAIAPTLMLSHKAHDSQEREEIKRAAQVEFCSRQGENRIFYQEHSPYYCIKQFALKLNSMMESLKLSESAIKAILLSFGVNEGRLESYKMKGQDLFNRFHIKFDALLLAYHACLEHKILFDFKELKYKEERGMTGSQWLYNPRSKRFAGEPKDLILGLEWHFNEIFSLGGRSGKKTSSHDTQSHGSMGTGKTTHKTSSYTSGNTMFKPAISSSNSSLTHEGNYPFARREDAQIK